MLKKLIIMVSVCSFFIFPNMTQAATVDAGYFGTTSTTDLIMYADSTYKDDTWIDLTVDGSGSGFVIWFGDTGGTVYQEIGRSAVPGTVTAPSGAVGFKLQSSNGLEIYATIGHSTNPLADTAIFTAGSSSGGGGSTSRDYTDQLNQIIAAIPPPPNWSVVADTFRDSIAPRIKADLEDLLGRAPSAPAAPGSPAIPDLPPDLNDRGLKAPTGNEAPGLEDSTFSEGDIKDQAPTIQERQDPTQGGFKINNPLDGLPSQEEFMKNIPKEGDNQSPANPKEEENNAPTPEEGDNAAPSPTEGENIVPDNPTEQENIAPSPGGEGGFDTAPIPTEEGTAPLPTEEGTAPLPGNDGSTAPLPGQP